MGRGQSVDQPPAFYATVLATTTAIRRTVMSVDDIVGLHVVGRYQGQNIVNNLSYHIAQQTSPEGAILESLCDAWDTQVKSAWLARHLVEYMLVGLKAHNLVGAAKLPGFLSIGTAGDVIGTEAPAPVCRTITLYTDSAKYRRRGRVQLSGSDIAMFDTDDGSVLDAEVTALGTLAALLEDSITANDDLFDPCIPANVTDPYEIIHYAIPRKTPSMIRSRRIRQFLVG